ncbi:hypothetical protein [Gymnodinialimonas hymeniacidonis]|uniref:hypothetical protein n=1 Tax=Gymnodinialimonas hymeniacidonis TaxID=3126508 RepID=UPI0034C664D0
MHVFPDGFDFSREFMARDGREAVGARGHHAPDVRTADPARGYFYQNFIGRDFGRDRHVLDAQIAWCM